MRFRPGMVLGGVLAVLSVLTACAALQMGTAAATPTPIVPPVPTHVISIEDAMARPVPVAGGNGAIYLTVVNGRETALQLVEAESPAAAVVEIHETVMDDGVMRMVHRAEGLSIAPMSYLHLQPGGKHIMLVELANTLVVGDTVELQLVFEGEDGARETMELTVPVLEPDRVIPLPAEQEEAGQEDTEHEGH